ncbi:unnamed protein product [Linum trigynum]|uniref:UBN2 domain-containing protein n=1 Tax=Linum trigynum TaxID=586398 RepID=A0AAV2G451_9ROSI
MIMYILAVTTKDQFLPHFKGSKSPKETWDTLSTIFTRTNEARLQRLVNELISLSQGHRPLVNTTKKLKNICAEFSKLDLDNPVSEARTRRIIFHGLRSEFKGIVIATRGLSKEPTQAELQNLLENEEILVDNISKVSIKEDEKMLLSKSKDSNSGEKALA